MGGGIPAAIRVSRSSRSEGDCDGSRSGTKGRHEPGGLAYSVSKAEEGREAMSTPTWTLATAVTGCRLAFLPVLWWWALGGHARWVGIGVVVAFMTDVLDGQLARRLHQVTALGARLDTIADSLLEASALLWLVQFCPEILQAPYAAWVAVGLVSWLAIIAVGVSRFRRFLNLHLYTAKASGVFGALFFVDALVSGFRPALFYLAFATFILANVEGLLVMLTRTEVDEHIGSILRRPPSAGGPRHSPQRHAPWFVVNPNASDVRYESMAERIRRQLAGRPGVVSPGLPELDGRERRLVVAVGGDGTVSRVINGCDPELLRLGLLPRGSANDLATEIGIASDFERAWEVIEAPRYEAVDLIRVNSSRFATCGGLGFATDVAARANSWKTGSYRPLARSLGALVYPLAALAEAGAGVPRPIRARIAADGETRVVDLCTAIVSNQPRFGRSFTASRGASNRDGYLHLCVMEAPGGRARLLWLCSRFLSGKADRCREVFQLRARAMTIETERDVTFFGDGEPLAHGRRFHIEVLPGALEVAVAGRPRPELTRAG
jgi:YegS/Rv2252/BmrU family lipid kinase